MKITSKMVAGAFIIAIMVLSVFGFVLNYATNNTNALEFNNIDFVQTPQGWTADLLGKERLFIYHPAEISGLGIEGAQELLGANSIAITYDDSTQAELLAQVQYYLEQNLNDQVIIIRGVTNPGSALTQITCEDATSEQPVIQFAWKNQTRVDSNENCIRVETQNQALLVQYADKIAYYALGIYHG